MPLSMAQVPLCLACGGECLDGRRRRLQLGWGGGEQRGEAGGSTARVGGGGSEEPSRKLPPGTSLSSLHEELLVDILRRVSLATGKSTYALVCRQWRRLSVRAQVAMHARDSGTFRVPDSSQAHLPATPSCLPPLTIPFPHADHPSSLSPPLSSSQHSAQSPPLSEEEKGRPKGQALEEAKYCRFEFSEAELLAHICRYRGLRALRLQLSSRVDAAFVLGGVAMGLPGLESLDLDLLQLQNPRKLLSAVFLALPGLKHFCVNSSAAAIPASVTTLARLESLRCAPHEPLPADLGRLSRLRSLSVQSRRLQSLPDSLSLLTSLTHLSLRITQLQTLPPGLGDNMGELVSLQLWCQHLKEVPESLVSGTRLESVDIACAMKEWPSSNSTNSTNNSTNNSESNTDNDRSDGTSSAAGAGGRAVWPRMRTLSLLCCPELAHVPDSLLLARPGLTRLELPVIAAAQIPLLVSLPNLRTVKLQRMYGDIPASLAGAIPNNLCASLRSLRCLHLTNVRSPVLPPNLGSLACLEELLLDNSKEITELPPSLGSLQSLSHLWLRRLPRLARLPPDMHRLTSLRKLLIKACPALRGLPCELGALRNLQLLQLEQLPLVDFIPEAFRSNRGWPRVKVAMCEGLGSQVARLTVPTMFESFPGDVKY